MGRSWIAKKCMRNKAAEEMKEGDRSRLGVQAVPPCHSQHKHPPRSSPRSLWHAAGSRRGRSHSAAHPWACTWPRAGQGWLSCSPRTPPGLETPRGVPPASSPHQDLSPSSRSRPAPHVLPRCEPAARAPHAVPGPCRVPGLPAGPSPAPKGTEPYVHHPREGGDVGACTQPKPQLRLHVGTALHVGTHTQLHVRTRTHAGRQLLFCSRAVQEGAPSRALATLRSWAAAKAEALGADLT